VLYLYPPSGPHRACNGITLPLPLINYGPESSAGITTNYGLDGPGSNPSGGRDFPHMSRSAFVPTQPSIQWIPSIFQGQNDRGVALTTHSSLSAEVEGRLEIYNFFPSGPSRYFLGLSLP